MQQVKERVYLFVRDHCQYGRVEGRPGMAAVMGLAVLAATSLHFFPLGETADIITVHDPEDHFVIRLIE